jgi:hypothetical protein
MGRGSHLLAQSVGGCDSGQRFATPCRRDTDEGQLTFCVAWAFLWSGFVVLLAAIFVLLFFGFDLLRVFLSSSACSSSSITPGSGDSRARVRTCSVGGRVSDQR